MNELWHKRHHAQVANMALEPCRVGHAWEMARDGWAVFTGSEGADPTFRAFFVDEETARLASSVQFARDGEGEPLFFDPCVSVAVITPRGIIASNDVDIDSHEKLRAKLSASWWDDERLVSGCIGRELDCRCPKCVTTVVRVTPEDGGDTAALVATLLQNESMDSPAPHAPPTPESQFATKAELDELKRRVDSLAGQVWGSGGGR